MSLHQLAHHVQSAGRGDDKVLVHMTPGEVGGLQALAMAHGGSLTINPETGLPEAGFLSSLLPMIAGFALGPGGFALMSPMQAALTVGAVGTAATGSLGKGLMMGLGAYGGAGLGAGLSSMGTTTPTAAVPQMNVATTGVEGMKSGMYGGQGIFSQGIPPTPTTSAALTGVTPQGGMAGLPAYTPPKPIYDMGAGLQQQLTPTGQLTQQMAAAPAYPPVKPIYNIGETIKYTPSPAATPTANVAAQVPSEATVDVAASVPQTQFDKLGAGFKKATDSFQGLKDLYAASEAAAPYGGVASLGSYALGSYYDKLDQAKPPKEDTGMIRPYTYERTQRPEAYDIGAPIYSATPGTSAEQDYFTEKYTALAPYRAPGPEYAAEGGLMGYAIGGPIEEMAAMNSVGANTGYPMAGLQTSLYTNPMVQRPEAVNIISPSGDAGVGAYSGEQKFAGGGISHLGDYSDGGRLLKGPGDGVSDSIPAVIGNRQPARLADGEFVVPARIVSELGNGSTEAGARKLYAMMDRVQKARRKTVGKNRVAANTKSEKYLPA